eukprot:gene4685-6580_t
MANPLIPSFSHVFISYRVLSDGEFAEELYENILSQKLMAWFNKRSFQTGMPWDRSYLEAVLGCLVFVPVISRKAIASSDKHNFRGLIPSSPCDNLLLEYMLILELVDRFGETPKVFPVFIGETNPYSKGEIWTDFSLNLLTDNMPDVSVVSVERKLIKYLIKCGLGEPKVPNRTVRETMQAITYYQGYRTKGNPNLQLNNIISTIVALVSTLASPSTIPQRFPSTIRQVQDRKTTSTINDKNNSANDVEIKAAIQLGTTKWNRSKICFVGEGRSGKTATANSLFGINYVETASTIGINQLTSDIKFAKVNESGLWSATDPIEKEYENAIACNISSLRVHEEIRQNNSNLTWNNNNNNNNLDNNFIKISADYAHINHDDYVDKG